MSEDRSYSTILAVDSSKEDSTQLVRLDWVDQIEIKNNLFVVKAGEKIMEGDKLWLEMDPALKRAIQ